MTLQWNIKPLPYLLLDSNWRAKLCFIIITTMHKLGANLYRHDRYSKMTKMSKVQRYMAYYMLKINEFLNIVFISCINNYSKFLVHRYFSTVKSSVFFIVRFMHHKLFLQFLNSSFLFTLTIIRKSIFFWIEYLDHD